MKKMFFVMGLALAVATPISSYAGGEVKEVCKDKLDKAGKAVKGKDGKVQQICKKIKVHKKLEGKTVPPAKK